MTAIVTCGHTRAGLACVRALGRAGVAVCVAAPLRPALAMWSRYASSTLLVPDAATDAKRFAEAIGEEARGRGAHLVLPSTDAALWALSRFREALPPEAQAAMPPHDAVVRVLDRAALHDRARSLGLRSVAAVRIDGPDDVATGIAQLKKAPAVAMIVRPLVAWVERDDGTRRLAEATAVDDIAALESLLAQRDDLVAGGCLIEPRPPGRWLGYGAVCAHGEVLAEVFHERLRERDDLSGISTLARTIVPDAEMRAASQAILRALLWQGPALVELLRTETGELVVVNVIGRVWGSIQLAINAGMNAPLYIDALARHREASLPFCTAQPNQYWRWTVGDSEVVLLRMARLLRAAVGGGGVWQRLRHAASVLDVRDVVRARPDVLDLDDPLPFLLELEQRKEEGRRSKAARGHARLASQH